MILLEILDIFCYNSTCAIEYVYVYMYITLGSERIGLGPMFIQYVRQSDRGADDCCLRTSTYMYLCSCGKGFFVSLEI